MLKLAFSVSEYNTFSVNYVWPFGNCDLKAAKNSSNFTDVGDVWCMSFKSCQCLFSGLLMSTTQTESFFAAAKSSEFCMCIQDKMYSHMQYFSVACMNMNICSLMADCAARH